MKNNISGVKRKDETLNFQPSKQLTRTYINNKTLSEYQQNSNESLSLLTFEINATEKKS